MEKFNLKNIKTTTFEAVLINFKINGVNVDLTDYVIEMKLRKEYNGKVFLSLTSVANVGITITDAVNGNFKINEQIIDIDPYNYIWDMKFTAPDGTVKIWYGGEFLIEKNIT